MPDNFSDEDSFGSKYQPPPEKSIAEIMAADREDESLRYYKRVLLGAAQFEKIIVDANDPRKVIIKKLSLFTEGNPPEAELDLSGNLSELKGKVFTINQGTRYKIHVDFIVQREIVHGLKYVQIFNRSAMPKATSMIGSYAPKRETQRIEKSIEIVNEETRSGIITHGTYPVTSLFTDDDGNIYLKWEWIIKIKKCT